FDPFINKDGVHQEGMHEGSADETAAARAVGTWRKVRDKLRQGEMPPPDQMEADPRQVERALRWLDVRLGTGPGSWPLDPGRVTIRRLNRAEYANTIRDLLDLEIDVARELP